MYGAQFSYNHKILGKVLELKINTHSIWIIYKLELVSVAKTL